MRYAVIKITGRQYKVAEGDELLVDKLVGKADPEVLLIVDDKGVKVGKPKVAGAKVSISVVEPVVKGKKVLAATFKAKARTRKVKGIRPQYSRIKVGKITA
jgi:large subunit ribosomal protein L21